MDKSRQGENTRLVDQVAQVTEPLCLAENFELVHVEQAAWNKEILIRVYVDKPGGITLDDCVYISRQLGDLLDVHIPELGKYRLEVSSPGPNRPLKKKDDFHRFQGARIKVETRMPIDGRLKFTGVLETVQGDAVVIKVDNERVDIPDSLIRKATLAGQ